VVIRFCLPSILILSRGNGIRNASFAKEDGIADDL
jgi:hypothetical protein